MDKPKKITLGLILGWIIGILFGLNAVSKKEPAAIRIAIVVMLGASVSIAIELIQYFVDRHTSILDVYANASGTLIGANIAWFRQNKKRSKY